MFYFPLSFDALINQNKLQLQHIGVEKKRPASVICRLDRQSTMHFCSNIDWVSAIAYKLAKRKIFQSQFDCDDMQTMHTHAHTHTADWRQYVLIFTRFLLFEHHLYLEIICGKKSWHVLSSQLVLSNSSQDKEKSILLNDNNGLRKINVATRVVPRKCLNAEKDTKNVQMSLWGFFSTEI